MQGEADLIQPGREAVRLPVSGPAATVGCGALVALILGFGLFGANDAPSHAKGDHVSAAQIAEISAMFHRAHGALMPADPLSAARAEDLMLSLGIARAQAERWLAKVDNGERTLGWIALWDNFDEDGDVVTLSTAGISLSVPLTHSPTRLLIPYIPGQPVFVTGERDGMGGGVTAAVELSSGALPLPPLAVGQTVALPLQ